MEAEERRTDSRCHGTEHWAGKSRAREEDVRNRLREGGEDGGGRGNSGEGRGQSERSAAWRSQARFCNEATAGERPSAGQARAPAAPARWRPDRRLPAAGTVRKRCLWLTRQAEPASTSISGFSAPRTVGNERRYCSHSSAVVCLWQPKLTKTLTPEGSAILPVHPSSVIPRTRAFSPKCCLLTTSSRPPELPLDHTLLHRWPPQETLSQRILLRGQRSGRRGNGTRNC